MTKQKQSPIQQEFEQQEQLVGLPRAAELLEMAKAELDIAQWQLVTAKAKAAVSGGEWCAENRAAGRGRCGACSWCARLEQQRKDWVVERIEQEIRSAGMELQWTDGGGSDCPGGWHRVPYLNHGNLQGWVERATRYGDTLQKILDLINSPEEEVIPGIAKMAEKALKGPGKLKRERKLRK